ncbi:hypothetical protein Tco_0623874 [Tanacetum coccineum]|uniref:Uncharacterized protein n=1 Tax=Tanacetum coccineum TaxID=301880 RepID=A0ABQ4WCC9_9ASTR
MFWHYVRDDFKFTTIPKPKTTKKKADSKSSPKMKYTQASKVALTKAQQMKIAIERSKIQTHSSHASGLGDGVNIQSKDDEDNDEHDSENNNDDEDDDQENVSGETKSDKDGDDFVHPNLSTYKADDQEEEKEEEKANDDEDVSSNQMVSTPPNYEITKEEENQEDNDDVMGGEQEDEEDEELISSLEIELSELKQTNQFSKALSSIPGIVYNYLASKMKDAVNVAVQLKSNKLKEEAQAENDEFLKQIDSNIKAIIKDQVKAQVSKIMSKVEKYVTESLGAEVLARSSNQPQKSYAATTSLSEFKLKKILIDKLEENKSMKRSDIQKNL